MSLQPDAFPSTEVSASFEFSLDPLARQAPAGFLFPSVRTAS